MKTTILFFKWTISRGRDTYGYNICTLYADEEKVGRCNGGGYDMQGTAFGQFLQNGYQDRLLKLHRRAGGRYSIKGDNYKRLKALNPGYSGHGEFYGMTAYYERGQRKPDRISLDGACGFSCIEKIAKAIGLRLKFHSNTKNSTTYTITDWRNHA